VGRARGERLFQQTYGTESMSGHERMPFAGHT